MPEPTAAYLIAAATLAGLFATAQWNRIRGWRKQRSPVWLTFAGLLVEDFPVVAVPPAVDMGEQLRRLNQALSEAEAVSVSVRASVTASAAGEEQDKDERNAIANRASEGVLQDTRRL